MNFRFVFTLGVAGSLALTATGFAQKADRDRVRIKLADRAVTRLVTKKLQTVAVQTSNEDPCRDAGWDDNYYRSCEVREDRLPAGPLTVDAGRNGGIRVDGWDRNEIRIQAVVTAHARSEADAKQLASEVQVQAGSGRVSSTGPSTQGRQWWSVSFRINVPQKNDLDLSAHNGGVSITGVSGRITFQTTNGGVNLTDLGGEVRGETRNGGLNVRLGGTRWEGAGLDVETSNGGVNLSIPEGYNAELTTRTVNGGFRSEFPMTIQGELNPRRGISTTLGAGGAPVRVRTTNGGLRINKR